MPKSMKFVKKKQFRYLLHCHKYNIHGITLEINKKDTNK